MLDRFRTPLLAAVALAGILTLGLLGVADVPPIDRP
jgi:hypothetical protein